MGKGIRYTDEFKRDAVAQVKERGYPKPSLMGESAAEQANIEMWARRIEQQIFALVSAIGLHEIPYFEHKVEQMPEYAAWCRRAFSKK